MMIHPFDDIRNNIHINSIFHIANKTNEQKYNVIKASEVEEILFGDNKFIDKKDFSGGT
ncbi:hypothetical protein [Chryseobacterium indoltheticum]|uniref:hypothetical protein n=1 Tax=Chryseobacterium indoltheticum TaxID=254 RepID=UPI003F49AE0B